MNITTNRTGRSTFSFAVAHEVLPSIRPGARLSRVFAHASSSLPHGCIACICEFDNGQLLRLVASLAGETFNAWLKEQIEARVAALIVIGLARRSLGRSAV